MSTVQLLGLLGGALTAHVSLDATGQVFPSDQFYVGMSILRPERVYDYEPIILQQGTIFATQQDVAWAIEPTLLPGSTVVVAVWKGYPSPTATRIVDVRIAGNEIYEQQVVNPFQEVGEGLIDITQTAAGAANTALNALPLLLMLGVAIFAGSR